MVCAVVWVAETMWSAGVYKVCKSPFVYFVLFCHEMFFWKESRMTKQLVAESPAQCAENEDWLG